MMTQERGDGSADASALSSKNKSKRPKYSRFTQQELPACKPILTPGRAISSFIFVGIIFIPIGLACLFASEKVNFNKILNLFESVKRIPCSSIVTIVARSVVVEIVYQYDTNCIPSTYSDRKLEFIKNPTTNKTCIRTLTITKKMKGPIFIYYQLDNFYQNHRRYVKSRSDKQLRSKDSETETKNCSPEGNLKFVNGTEVPIVPCGLIAWSLFNDTYGFSIGGNTLEVNKKNIAWKSDKDHKFGKDVIPKNFQAGGLQGGAKLNESIPLSQQEDLMVWMRTAALPTFRKLYGKIDQDLDVNQEIEVVIENNYNTYNFGGKKKLVLSTTTWIGGKNDFLGVAYLTIGGICLFLAICFILLYVIKPRPLGDPSYLSWNLNPEGR